MKKLDKLILKSFLGPFILTFMVSDFILLLIYMLKYFDDLIGKNLGADVFGKLMLYFSINMIPTALPLGILVSSLMTYGKLGEHFELTAIKGAGISLLRVLRPTFVFVVFISIGAFFINNHLVPYANLRAFSLLYDIKQAKPTLDLKEGQFYTGLPKFSMKVRKKYPDGIAMKNVVIYDHKKSNGNKKVIIADSCRMFTVLNDRYLKLELFHGNHYLEQREANKKKTKDEIEQFVRTKFDRMDMIFSLASFDLNNTDMDLFAGNRYMKSTGKLTASIDSMKNAMIRQNFRMFTTVSSAFRFHMHGFIEPPAKLLEEQNRLDSITQQKDIKKRAEAVKFKIKVDSIELAVGLVADSGVAPQVGTDSIRKKTHKKLTKKLDADRLIIKHNPNILSSSGHQSYPVSSAIQYGKTEMNDPVQRFDNTSEIVENNRRKKLSDDSLHLANDSIFLVVKRALDSVYALPMNLDQILTRAVSNARNVKTNVTSILGRKSSLKRQIDSHEVEKYKKYAQAFSCLMMFLIGAPLGAIIKRGGLGLPVIVAIFFFIIFYVLTSAGDKWAKSGVMPGFYAAWIANTVLIPFGIMFLRQARADAKVFDPDFYNVWIDDVKKWWKNRKA